MINTSREKSMSWFKSVTIFLFVILGFIFTLLFGEWVYSEIRFQTWLHQSKYRLDFSQYDTPNQLRAAILTKIPLQSSVDEVQAFRQAYGYPYQDPELLPQVPFYRSRANRGLFGLKSLLLMPGVWVIYFELDPVDHSLIDIKVSLGTGL